MTARERPILFSAPMVRALLAGTKTQTRRAAKRLLCMCGHPIEDHAESGGFTKLGACVGFVPLTPCPYGKAGDRLWVRERLLYDAEYGHFYAADGHKTLGRPSGRTYLAERFPDYSEDASMPNRGVPSIHMPRRYSRITLEITGVRVERLQEISEADAIAEGLSRRRTGSGDARTGTRDVWCVGDVEGVDPVHAYSSLWESINGAGSWDANPWVWCLTFERALP